MKYIIGLENSEGKKVIGITDVLNENETEVGKQVLNIANSMVKQGESWVLSSASKYKVTSIKSENSKKIKIMEGNKNYGFLVIGDSFKTFEDKVLSVAGEKSAYNSVMRYLAPSRSQPLLGILIYLIDSSQAKHSNNEKSKVDKQGNVLLTIREAINEKRISLMEFYNTLYDMGLAQVDDVKKTETVYLFARSSMNKGTPYTHVSEALKGNSVDLWRYNFMDAMSIPEPIETKEDLASILCLDENDYKKKEIFNVYR
ncbi:hypothetical protein [Sinanaerobacter sp. ZZT-01]|uniref:hypothetical protein n=1 Tax=Sinanaerobacter sp. ZZT-01 TaxID=3111540 RepID=UPI002D790537|nr:hypothetical protein [Sinanaerobacter sp. ZZT-01]WRR92714.1 hypothetical protein U5921_11755 [Sinanaerobacter sp. ZZT-01]